MELTETVFPSVRHKDIVKTHQTVSLTMECIRDEYTQSQEGYFLKLCHCLCFIYKCVSNLRLSLWPQFCAFLMLFSSFRAFLLFHFEQSYVAC
jgi:hypothetical protein